MRRFVWAGLLIALGAATHDLALRAQAPARPAVSDEQAMRQDLAHMRVLVGQMERNVGFVDSGQTPLKHQFQLEIEMWNLVLDDMQRRLPPAKP
jgi:hypothetical protein